MRGAGLSLRRLLAMCLPPTLALMLLIGLSGEFVVPALHHRAETERTVLRSGNIDLLEGHGLWSRFEDRFVNVRELRVGHAPEGVSVYEFGPGGELLRSIEAARVEPLRDRRWRLFEPRIKNWGARPVSTTRQAQIDLGPFWSAAELPVLGQSLAAMPPSALLEYAGHLRATGQDDTRVRTAFWQAVALPWSAGSMVLLAAVIGVGFGSTRSAAFGWRILTGAAIGTGFYLITQILNTGGQLLGLDQAIVVAVPVLLAVALAALLAAHGARPR
jgi:LPS export ABC transporter permease LptG